MRLLVALPLVAACAHGHPGPEHVHGHHRFEDAEKWAARFEARERDEWQRPDEVLEWLALAPEHKVADIGSATGYFPVRLARRAARVWGVDIEPDMVRYLNARARTEGLDNLFSILGTPEDPLLPEPVDLVLVVDTYHHIGARSAYFARLRAQLRPGGRVVIVDFVKGPLPVGPPDAMKLAPEEVDAELKEAGFARTRSHALPYQYVLEYAPITDAR